MLKVQKTGVDRYSGSHGDIVSDSFQVRFQPSKRKTIDKIFVTISGEFTIDHITEIYEAIRPVSKEHTHISIKLLEIGKLDLAAVQLLHFVFLMNQNLTVDASKLEPAQKQLLSAAGLMEIVDRKYPPVQSK